MGRKRVAVEKSDTLLVALQRISEAFADVPIDELEQQVARTLTEVRADQRREGETARGDESSGPST